MVKICSTEYPVETEDKYKSHFNKFNYPLSSFQKYAIESIVEGNHVLVTAHTGSGKTLPAEFAIQHFVGMGKKVVYCSPIKALSNQKYYEFTNKYPHISFGIYTCGSGMVAALPHLLCQRTLPVFAFLNQLQCSLERVLGLPLQFSNGFARVVHTIQPGWKLPTVVEQDLGVKRSRLCDSTRCIAI